MFWEFYLGSSVQIISFLIVILDQVLVETCGSIGLEIFVHTHPPIGFYTFRIDLQIFAELCILWRLLRTL